MNPEPILTIAQQTLPQGGSIPLGLALCAGLILWTMGSKLIKPVFLLFGLATGAFVGATIVPLTGLEPFEIGSLPVSPGAAGIVVGGVIGALVSLALMRMVITMSAAIAFAAAGLLGAMIFLHFNPSDQAATDQALAEQSSALAESNQLEDLSNSLTLEAAERSVDLINGEDNALFDEETKQDILDAAERSRAFLGRVRDAVQAELDKRPARDKTIIFASMLGGLALGLLVGVTMPKRTAALVTALFGSAVWMSAGVALLTARNGDIPQTLDRSAVVWASAWVGVTMLGLLVQLGFLSRSSKSEDKDKDEDDD